MCSDRRRRELTPALLYGLAPAALLAMAGLRKISVLTAGQPGGPLSAVRDAVLHRSSGPASHAAHAEVTGRSTQSFGSNGFPKPPHHGNLGVVPRPHLPFTVAGGTAVAAAAAVVVTVVVPHLAPAQRPPGGGLTLGAPAPGGGPAAGSGTRGAPSSGGPGPRGATAPAPGPHDANGGRTAASPSASGGGPAGRGSGDRVRPGGARPGPRPVPR